MPTYVYECQSCHRQFEVEQRMSDAPLTDCECGEKGQLKRLISAGAGLIFKGSGFYITDYKGGNASAGTPAPKSGDCGSGCCPCADN
ncbi:zinc ribbon domain-containing protein [bacterium]|nr:zinc ribbon domain-containing protein [bacterium]